MTKTKSGMDFGVKEGKKERTENIFKKFALKAMMFH